MSNKVSINDLNPRPSRFTLSGKEYKLKKFSLAAQVWAANEFATAEESNGLITLSAKVEKLDPQAIGETCYFLLEDKSDFPTAEKFVNAFGDTHTLLKILLAPLNETLGVSQPTEDDTAEELEVKK